MNFQGGCINIPVIKGTVILGYLKATYFRNRELASEIIIGFIKYAFNDK